MKYDHPTRRLAALLLSVLMLTGLLSGCGGEEEIPQVTLRTMSVLGDDGTKEAYTSVLELYSARYPHVYHMGTLAEASNAYKLNATFESTYTASKYPHAVCYYIHTGILELSDQFVSVEEIRELYPDFASGVTEAALDSVRAADGKAYCIPVTGSCTAMAVNTALFERYSLSLPETWQELLTVSGVFSARGITAIANSPDDSAALLELICLGIGADSALDTLLSGEAPADEAAYKAQWQEVFRLYQELCGINSFPAAVTTNEILAALLQLAQVEAAKQTAQTTAVSASDASASDVPQVSMSDIPVQTYKANALELFNAGQAAMLIVDSDDLSAVTLENFTLIMLPECSAGSSRLVGGYDIGWFITRRAFRDKSVCDAVVAFVDTMVTGKAADSFAAMGSLPSVTSDGDVPAGLYTLAAGADGFTSSRRSSANQPYFARLEDIAAALSMKIITPELAAQLVLDDSLALTDVIEQPPFSTRPEPTQAVSGTDTNQ